MTSAPGHGGGATFDVVVPTIGRESLAALLDRLAAQDAAGLDRLILVDDRTGASGDPIAVPPALADRSLVARSFGRGPAAARNMGWKLGRAAWVVFVDDDVVPDPDWFRTLRADLDAARPSVGGVQGRVRVPRPTGRRPTDWERDVSGLETGAWITADMAYRRESLVAVGGFDEGFPSAYREDADLALRVHATGWQLERGRRQVAHPVRPAPWWISVRRQRGNADDARMRRRHGRRWRAAADAPGGRLPAHALIVGCGAVAVGAAIGRRPALARIAAGAWLAGTAELAAARIVPGPRSPGEVTAMALTSAAIPPVAVAHRLRGEWRARHEPPFHGRPQAPPAPAPASSRPRCRAVLFDRDGTLVHDVPYNGDPDRVEPTPGAIEAVGRLRAAGLPIAVVTNQSGVARGWLRREEVDAVHRRIEELLGTFEGWFVCEHDDRAGCTCRKPQPGLIRAAADRLGVEPGECVVIGDIGSDVHAARAAGARSILVPTRATRPAEIIDADEVATDLVDAVRRVLADAVVPS